MLRYIDVSGKTEDEAIVKALTQLNMDRDDVSVEVLERAKSGFLGIGATPATVRVSYDDGTPEPVPEKPVEAAPVYQPEQRQSKEEREAPKKEPEVKKEKPKPASKPSGPVSYQPEVLARDKKTESEKPAPEKEKRPARPVVEKTEPAAEPEELGEEIHDEKSEQIRTFLTGLLAQMGSTAEVRVYEMEKNRYKVILEGDKLGALIGRRGETLDAIQQLTSYAVNRGNEKNRARIQVDAENYRKKREQSLERLAEKVAAKVVKYRRNVTLEPMNAYERHVIHTALQNTANVSTFSIGTEPNRRVVVSYDRNK